MTRPWAMCQRCGRRTGCVALRECRTCRKEREEQERKKRHYKCGHCGKTFARGDVLPPIGAQRTSGVP